MNDTRRIHSANADQLAAWDGAEGEYWSRHAERFERSVAGHDEPFFRAAGIGPTDQVLDVGCGTGGSTLRAARAASGGHALGVDLSASMLAVARQRAGAEGIGNASFLQADAQVHPFPAAAYDVAIARTSAMFFGDHAEAFANLRRTLRPGARLVLMTWQPLAVNPWLVEIVTALSADRAPQLPPPGAGPFSLADPDVIRTLLTGAGFTDVVVEGSEAPMWFGSDPVDAADFILGLHGWRLDGLDDDGRRAVRRALEATTTAHHTDIGVTFPSAAWITVATRP